jgi:hypothetical protein
MTVKFQDIKIAVGTCEGATIYHTITAKEQEEFIKEYGKQGGTVEDLIEMAQWEDPYRDC